MDWTVTSGLVTTTEVAAAANVTLPELAVVLTAVALGLAGAYFFDNWNRLI